MVSTRDNSVTTEIRNQPAPAYTPGPWEFSLSGHYGYSTLWNPATRKEVLTTGGFNDGDYPIVWMGEEASEADLALICAAPDLLAALIGMADAYVALLLIKAEDPSRFKEPGSPYANALAAIQKATGAQS